MSVLINIPEIEFLRDGTIVEADTDTVDYLLENAPFMNGMENLDHVWLKNAWNMLNKSFALEIRKYDGTVSEYFNSLRPEVQIPGRIYFHLVENKKEGYPFAFLATYSVDDKEAGRIRHLPLKNALEKYRKDSGKLLLFLSTVYKAANKSRFISELVESGELFHPIGLSSNEAYIFLKEAEIYQEAGIICRIPKWWKNKTTTPKLSIRIGEKGHSHLGFDSIVSFRAEIAIAGENLTPEEVRQLLLETEGLSLIKGKWVELDHARLNQILDAFERADALAGKSGLSILEAMHLNLNPSGLLNLNDDFIEVEISNEDWLENVLTRMTSHDESPDITCGSNFLAVLRPYQKKGLSWLYLMKSLGLGACLADDMGLGKTIQVLALLNCCRERWNERTLLVIPSSLLGNWVNEITRFAPTLEYILINPSERKASDVADVLQNKTGIFITTYGMLTRYTQLRDIIWDNLILDEAQAIKNPASKQTQAAKQIKARFKVAMTGTPVENCLADLWSLFDFLNKGLLGSAREFSSYTDIIRERYQGYSHLKQVVGPFILRRLKTDKNVIDDLPEKIEMKTYSTLSKKQALLYTTLVDEIKEKLEAAGEGLQRKGLILSSIMRFKQICNHPDQYLGQSVYSENESGKYERLKEICKIIYEKRERVLVFTQFKEMAEPLKKFLETVFDHEGLMIHGGTPVSDRKNIVERFQGNTYVPFMVLSIKAGGLGLNLTAANHVVHFDRWWNPAVENQATDRAFRIGQKRKVIVHKFITQGTIEEKIDIMIEDKINLSREIIPSKQEAWITEIDNKQLIDMMSLKI